MQHKIRQETGQPRKLKRYRFSFLGGEDETISLQLFAGSGGMDKTDNRSRERAAEG